MRREWTYRGAEKAKWGFGAWLWEPDKVQWIDAESDLDCLALRNHSGVWCGYVGLPPGHPLHGVAYDDVEESSAHGGLIFAGACREAGDPSEGVCHIPAPGRPDHVWWLGFDCAHGDDLVPGLWFKELAELRARIPRHEVYRDLAYVQRCITQLARELG